MAAVASITITVDEKGVVTALNNVQAKLTAVQSQFNNGFSTSTTGTQAVTYQIQQADAALQRAGQTSGRVFQEMQKDHMGAVNSLRLVTEEAGIRLPRALLTLLAQSETVMTAVGAAFSAFAFVGFVQIAGLAVSRIGDVIEGITGWKAEADLLAETTKALNEIDVKHIETMQALRNEYDLIGLSGSQLIAQQRLQNSQALAASQASQGAFQMQLDMLKKQRDAKKQAMLDETNDSQGASISGVLANFDAPFLDLDAKIAQVTKQLEGATAQSGELAQKGADIGKRFDITFGDETQTKINAATKAMQEQYAAAAKLNEEGIKQLDEYYAQQLRVDAEIDQEKQAIFQHGRDMLDADFAYQLRLDDLRTEEAKKAADEQIKAQEEAQRKAQQTFDQTTRDIEGLFDAITTGSIGKYFLKQFEHLVAQMVAAWVLGMQGMQTSSLKTLSGHGGGGILDILFGGSGVPGLGGGSSSIATPPFIAPGVNAGGSQGSGVPVSLGDLSGIPNLSNQFSSDGGAVTSTAAAALGLPIGTAASLPGTISSPTKAGAAAAGGPLGALLSKVFPHGITIGGKTVSGAALAALGVTLGVSGFTGLLSGQGNTAVGALETIGGSALTGFAIGGPVGAVVGGIIGAIGSFFGWLFGSSKIDKQRNALETQLEQQLKVVTDSYDLHHTDYGTAIADAEQLRTQFEGAQDQVKKGANMQQYVGQWVDQAEKHINDFETERVRRSDVISNLPLPEFASGGFTDSYMRGGSMQAILHPNEAILNPRGRAAIGDAAISAANNGQSQPSAPSNVNIHFHEGSIQGGPGANAKDLADEIMRRLRQKFGDRGLNFGGAMG